MADARTLILMRHATAGHQGATRDHDRPLTEHGKREAADAGRWMRASLPAVDTVLCSTATRTRQTLMATGIQAPASYQDGLYAGGAEDILELLRRVPSAARTVLVIGHAPGVPSVAATLDDTARQAGRNDPDPDVAVRHRRPVSREPNSRDPDSHEPGAHQQQAALRRFPAGAVAVLSVEPEWGDVADSGAELVTVRLPGS